MGKHIFIALFLVIPLGLFAQFDDPFGNPGSGGGDDPFGNPNSGGSQTDPFSTPQQPSEPTETEPINTPQPTNPNPPTNTNTADNNDDPFGGGSGAANDPFSSGGDDTSGGFGADAGGGLMGGGGSVFDNMADTLIDPLVPDFPWEQKAVEERQMLANYTYEEYDIFWAKTVYREIDIREKMNHPFAYPRAPFMTVLLDVLNKNPDIPVYKEDVFTGRDFSDITRWDSIETTLGNKRSETVYEEDASGDIVEREVDITDKFRVSKVRRFAIKEVWFFDKKHSRMRVEIMGIAPLYEVSAVDQGADAVLLQQMGMTGMTTQQTLFWVYYPDIREYLSRYQTYNPLNDALRMSWDDLLTSRFFSSYITKASNPLDRKIKDYTRNGLDALYESEEVKEEIFNFEHDLWSY